MSIMGRPALQVKAQHSLDELNKAYRASDCKIQQRKIQVVKWLMEGRSRIEVCELSTYSKPTIVRIIREYNEAGLAGIANKRRGSTGRKPLLDDKEMLRLGQAIHQDYAQGIYWNGKKVVQWVQENLGKDIHVQRAYEYFKQIGMSQQTPRPHHAKTDPHERERFKKN